MAEPTRSLRVQLYELAETAKEMAEDPDLGKLSTDDAQFISTINVTMLNMKNKEK